PVREDQPVILREGVADPCARAAPRRQPVVRRLRIPPARAYGHLRWAELSRRGSRRPPRAAHARARARPSASDVPRHPASSTRLSPHSEVTPELNPAQRASLALPPAR